MSKDIEEFEINALHLDKSPPIYSPARRSYEEEQLSERKKKKEHRKQNSKKILKQLSLSQRMMSTDFIKNVSPLKEV